ncbi:MAG: hypothetical protein K2W95_00920 [Candidatus Obscuribacterales bacterium]|nr:hypothetical protein [Candidatus Obscuribacterales bacterium]
MEKIDQFRVAALTGLLSNPLIVQATQVAAQKNHWPPQMVHSVMTETAEAYAQAMLRKANEADKEAAKLAEAAKNVQPESDPEV